MRTYKNVQQCRWAESTLFLAAPQWLDAWEFPWSCRSTGTFQPVADTRACCACDRWESRDSATGCGCTPRETR